MFSVKPWKVFELWSWTQNELEKGNRIKASHINKAFERMCKYLDNDEKQRVCSMQAHYRFEKMISKCKLLNTNKKESVE